MSKRTDMVDQFVAEFGQDAFDEICEAAWAQENTDRVCFLNHHMINAANWIHDGTFTTDDRDVTFRMECGDMVGCDFRYGDDLELKKPVEYRRVFRPRNPDSPVAKAVFPYWQKQPWFIEQQGKMNYDLRFSPTSKIYDHYRDWADKRGMVIEYEQVQ